MTSDEQRCRRCGWPLAESREKGCVPGDCSFRCDCARVHRPGCPLYTAPPCKRCDELRAEVERLRAERDRCRALIKALYSLVLWLDKGCSVAPDECYRSQGWESLDDDCPRWQQIFKEATGEDHEDQ